MWRINKIIMTDEVIDSNTPAAEEQFEVVNEPISQAEFDAQFEKIKDPIDRLVTKKNFEDGKITKEVKVPKGTATPSKPAAEPAKPNSSDSNTNDFLTLLNEHSEDKYDSVDKSEGKVGSYLFWRHPIFKAWILENS